MKQIWYFRMPGYEQFDQFENAFPVVYIEPVLCLFHVPFNYKPLSSQLNGPPNVDWW
jgi:hypothetical protein